MKRTEWTPIKYINNDVYCLPCSGKASCESSGQSSTGAGCAAGRTDMTIMDIQILGSNPPPHNILPEKKYCQTKETNKT